MSENRIAELWGCGFNQYDQIDNSGRDAFELKKIDETHLSPKPQLSILWAGWADLICKSFPFTENDSSHHVQTPARL